MVPKKTAYEQHQVSREQKVIIDPGRGSGRDQWVKAISKSGTIRAFGVMASSISRNLAVQQGLSSDGSRALAEALIAGFILGSYCKPGERSNLNVQGDGWVKQALVDCRPDGSIRGYVIENPNRVVPEHDETREGPWGKGVLSVLRAKDSEQRGDPYIGTVPLLTGHLPKDLTFYWLQSEQVQSACGIATNLDSEGKIDSAGGFIVQALPGATEEEVQEIEVQVKKLNQLATQVAEKREPVHLLSVLFQNMGFIVLEKRDLSFSCACSWERVRRALMLIGSAEIQNILETQGEAQVHCDFCAKEYKATREDLELMLQG